MRKALSVQVFSVQYPGGLPAKYQIAKCSGDARIMQQPDAGKTPLWTMFSKSRYELILTPTAIIICVLKSGWKKSVAANAGWQEYL
jgi:hypothetical protein